jgi:ATP-dependent RNA helicase DDX10/DBP4
VDCPDSAEMYIHRVGRTARLNASGKALLFLTPQEEAGMMKELSKVDVKIEKLKVNPRHETSIDKLLSSLLTRDIEFKQVAMKALVTYFKWVFHQPNKEVCARACVSSSSSLSSSLSSPRRWWLLLSSMMAFF